MVGQLEISEPNKQIPTLNGWLFMGSFTIESHTVTQPITGILTNTMAIKLQVEPLQRNQGLEDDFPFQVDDFDVPC